MNLKPVDFNAIAQAGYYIYAYLRRGDHSPYYIGLSKTAIRPLYRYGRDCPAPFNSALIRVLRSGLSKEEACSWECFYISHYGRKDLGTGILRNRCEGGEGVYEMSPEGRKAQRKARIEIGDAYKISGLTIDEYMDLTPKQIDAMVPFLKRNSDLNGHDWLAGIRNEEGQLASGRKGNEVWSQQSTARFAEDFKCTIKEVDALTSYERDAFRVWRSRGHENATLAEWRERSSNYKPGVDSAEAAKRKAAQRLGIPEEVYLSLTYQQKDAMGTWMRRTGGTASEWLENSPNFGSRDGQDKKLKAAKKQGIPPDVYLRLTDQQKDSMRAWLRRNKQFTAVEWLVTRGLMEATELSDPD